MVLAPEESTALCNCPPINSPKTAKNPEGPSKPKQKAQYSTNSLCWKIISKGSILNLTIQKNLYKERQIIKTSIYNHENLYKGRQIIKTSIYNHENLYKGRQIIKTSIYNHGQNSVAKVQKHREKTLSPPLSVLIAYGHSFFVTTLIKRGRGDFRCILNFYHVHDCSAKLSINGLLQI